MKHDHRWTNTIHFSGQLVYLPKFKEIENTRWQKNKNVADFYLSQNAGKYARLTVRCVSFNTEAIDILKKQTKQCAVNVVGMLDRDVNYKSLRILVQNIEIAFNLEKDLLSRKEMKQKNGDKNDSN